MKIDMSYLKYCDLNNYIYLNNGSNMFYKVKNAPKYFNIWIRIKLIWTAVANSKYNSDQ